MTTTTPTTLFGGRVVVEQPPRGGYRVNADAVILAAFAAGARPARRAWDLGAGVGAVGLSLLHLGAADHVTMVEIDPDASALAASNATANGWSARVTVISGDVADVEGDADLVVCNPPYVPPGRGRVPSSTPRARAKVGDVGPFLDAARRVAGKRARVCFVYPAIEAVSLVGAMRARGLEPKRMRFVHGRPDAPARVVLVECRPAKPGGLEVLPPLIETTTSGKPSAELADLFAHA